MKSNEHGLGWNLATEAGRTITRNGVPFVSLLACVSPTGAPNFPEPDANNFARAIPALVAAVEGMIENFDGKFNVKQDYHKMVALEAARTALKTLKGEGE